MPARPFRESRDLVYSKLLHVGWRDVDANGHMRNTAYLDLAADTRMFYFAENGENSMRLIHLALFQK